MKIGDMPTFTTKFGYDDRVFLEQIEYPSGRKVKYTYDSDGRPLSAKNETGAVVYANEISYHASGVVSGLTFGNQLEETVSEYPQSRRPKRIHSGPLDITYHYDNVGNAKAMVNTFSVTVHWWASTLEKNLVSLRFISIRAAFCTS